jgi:hypothetical protein
MTSIPTVPQMREAATFTGHVWQREDGLVYADQPLHLVLHVRGGTTTVERPPEIGAP